MTDAVELAQLLAERTAWPQGRTVSGYQWGRSVWDVAGAVSRAAEDAGLELSVTGRSALAFLGVLGTTSPSDVRCWVAATEDELAKVAHRLELEPAPVEDSNVVIAPDPWGAGVNGRTRMKYDDWEAWIAHPVRVWCDVRQEPRGAEFAAQLWPEIDRRG